MSKVDKKIKKEKWEDPKLLPLALSDTESGVNTEFTERTNLNFPLGTPFAAS